MNQSQPTMQNVYACIGPDGSRIDVLASSPVAAQELAAKRLKCKAESVMARYRYSTGARHVPEKVERP